MAVAPLPQEHKQLRILPGGGHGLQGGGIEDEVYAEVAAFVKAALVAEEDDDAKPAARGGS